MADDEPEWHHVTVVLQWDLGGTYDADARPTMVARSSKADCTMSPDAQIDALSLHFSMWHYSPPAHWPL